MSRASVSVRFMSGTACPDARVWDDGETPRASGVFGAPATSERRASWANGGPPGIPAGHPIADQLVHLTCSVAWGAIAAPVLFGTGRRQSLAIGGLFGLGLWARPGTTPARAFVGCHA